MDLRDQLKNLFPGHDDQDFEMPDDEKDQKYIRGFFVKIEI